MDNKTILEKIDCLISISQRWLTIKEACLYAKMSKNTLMKCIRCGEVKATKRGGKWIVDRQSIDDYYQEFEFESLSIDLEKRIGL